MIRTATLLDIPRLLNLAEIYHGEIISAGHFIPDWDAELAAVNMINTMNSENGFAAVSIEDNKVVAFLWAVSCCPVPWSSHKAADCLMFYVHPEYRGALHTYRLIRAFKVWAEGADCVETRISTASGLDTSRVERLFSKVGFKPLGTTYHILNKGG